MTQLELAGLVDREDSWVSKVEHGGVRRFANVQLLQDALNRGGSELLDALLGIEGSEGRPGRYADWFATEVRREVLIWAGHDPVEVWERITIRATGPSQDRFDFILTGEIETRRGRPESATISGIAGAEYKHLGGSEGLSHTIISLAVPTPLALGEEATVVVATQHPGGLGSYVATPLREPIERMDLWIQLPHSRAGERVVVFEDHERRSGTTTLRALGREKWARGSGTADSNGLVQVTFFDLDPGLEYGVLWDGQPLQ